MRIYNDLLERRQEGYYFAVLQPERREEKKWVSYFYRAATTLYPCCVPTLGEFKRSWP